MRPVRGATRQGILPHMTRPCLGRDARGTHGVVGRSTGSSGIGPRQSTGWVIRSTVPGAAVLVPGRPGHVLEDAPRLIGIGWRCGGRGGYGRRRRLTREEGPVVCERVPRRVPVCLFEVILGLSALPA